MVAARDMSVEEQAMQDRLVGQLDPSWFGAREMTIGLVGNNLLNENIRNSVSYTKDEVLLPGIGVRAFANLKF